MEFMTKIENHLMVLDKKFQVLTNVVENLETNILDEFKMLEIEKNKLRPELGSRKNQQLMKNVKILLRGEQ